MQVNGYDTEFNISDTVYLRAAKAEAIAGIVVAVVVHPGSCNFMYRVAWGDLTTDHHYDFELSDSEYSSGEE